MGGADLLQIRFNVIDICPSERFFRERCQQKLLLLRRARIQHFAKLAGKPALDQESTLDDLIAILLPGKQRNPVVVQIPDILVCDVIDAVLKILANPGMLRLQQRRE